MVIKSKEEAIPMITMSEISEGLEIAGWPNYNKYELVFPPCVIENPEYRPVPMDTDISITASFPDRAFIPYYRIKEVAGKMRLFGYGVRYDPDATELAILPKQVEAPLPFE